jgi:hypothetical protein
MSTKIRLNLGLVCCILALGTLSGLACGPLEPGLPRKGGHDWPEKKEGKALMKMIDALANRNPKPKLVDDGVGKLPLFPAKYDWKEQERVLSALGKVSKERTPEMWEVLVQRIGDERYCLTVKDQNEFYAEGNWTVGDFCSDLAHDWLVGVCNRHLPNSPVHEGYPIHVDIGLTGGLEKWRKGRMDKQLYELQIEVCEKTVRQLRKAAKVPQRAKDVSRKKMKAEITILRRTKRPIFTDYSIRYAPPFTARDAMKARVLLQEKEK